MVLLPILICGSLVHGSEAPPSSPIESSVEPSAPDYKFRKETVMIPMRDGVKLATDIYFPIGEDSRWPVILIRTSYDKKAAAMEAGYFAMRGYVVAVQDCRGLFESEGTWEPFVNEPDDGYDTVEWLGTQPWSSGKVGMTGLSYLAWVQLWAAVRKPPHLVTVTPSCSPADPFMTNPYTSGVFMLPTIDLIQIFNGSAAGTLTPIAMREILYKNHEEVLNHLPVVDLDEVVVGKRDPIWRKWIQHNSFDAYWDRTALSGKLKELEIPVLLQTGWFDLGVGSSWLIYRELMESQSKFVKLVVGPWGHTNRSLSKWEDYDFGPEAATDLQRLFVRWFDYWLKGIDNGIVDEPSVDVFVMFSNHWLRGDTYPLQGTTDTKLFLSSGGKANTSKGDGQLVFSQVTDGAAFDRYTYDPGDPTPYPSYYPVTVEEQTKATMSPDGQHSLTESKQARHREVTESRSDILVYQTAPLAEPLSIAGPVTAVLYASTSAVDTDWMISFMDVDATGRILHLDNGAIRARFRNSMRDPELLEPDKVNRYDIYLSQSGITFQKGHRIRIEIASSFFPILSRNLNTGGHNEMETEFVKADQTIHHSAEHPSHLVLPVVALQE
jgi:putative CocE/NonD family hydrolase